MNMSFASQPSWRKTGIDSHLNRLLDDLVERTAHVQKATVLSRDGLALGSSAALRRDDAEHLSALAAGLQSLATGGALHFGGGRVHQTVIEMDGGYLFVTAAGEGHCVAVLAAPEADVGLLAYEMALIVKRLGRHMTAGRSAPGEVM